MFLVIKPMDPSIIAARLATEVTQLVAILAPCLQRLAHWTLEGDRIGRQVQMELCMTDRALWGGIHS